MAAKTPATLIFNPNAGGDALTVDDLLTALMDAGLRPTYTPTETEEELTPVLEQVEGVVIAAGGDGTLRAVALELLNRENINLALVPLGTANNIADALGIAGSTKDIVKGLATAKTRPFDVGQLDAPWGRDYFLEGAGLGIYADMLTHYDPEKGKSVLRAATTMKDVLMDYSARPCQALLDGEDISGDFVALEALNTRAIGPRLKLAPNADPGDGLFDVARVIKPEDVTLLDYVVAMFSEKLEQLDNVEVLRGRELSFHWSGEPLHVDGEVRPKEAFGLEQVKGESLDHPSGQLDLSILPGALQLLLPA